MQRLKTRYFIESFVHGLFWLVLYYALKGLTVSSYALIDRAAAGDAAERIGHAPSPHAAVVREDLTMSIGHTLFPYVGVVLVFLVLLFYSCAFWLFKKIIRYKNNARRAGIIAGWLLLVYSANYLLVSLLITLRSSQRSLGMVVPDKPGGLIPPNVIPLSAHWAQMQLTMALAFLAIGGVAAAYFFIKEWVRNELARSKAETLQVNTELRFLRSQVNPHFFFNTLNNLFSMALKEGKDNLADRIAKLSNMMRYMLYESDTDNVSLINEVGCLDDYLTLHQMRYAPSEVDVRFRYPEPVTIASVQVAPMLFIPFLENAFKHGVAIGQSSFIALEIAVSPQKLVFTCENTDHSSVKKLAEEKGGIGLENVKRRLELIYPGRYELQAGPQNGNYIVNLQIELPC